MTDAIKLESIDFDQISTRLNQLYQRSRKLLAERHAANEGKPLSATVMNLSEGAISTRLEGVDDALSGTEYAVWVLGETLCAVGGLGLMARVADAFEERHGTQGATWLDHRWDGVIAQNTGWVA